jgi:excisionase family DNA binding protein
MISVDETVSLVSEPLRGLTNMKADDVGKRPSKKSQYGSCEIPERSLNIREAATLLNICTKKVAELCRNGELAHHRIGNKLLFRPDNIRDFWTKRTVDGSEPQSVDSSHTKDDRRRILRKGSDAGQVTSEEIRSLCRQ